MRINFSKLFLISCLLTACGQGKSSINISEMQGTYLFVYPSGEAEVVIINPDSTYKKDIYRTYDEFQKKLPS
ncbi:MAG TPA: hypothetical protein VD908_14025 [Cytophagales bacterium]|nr:hypothetical protein [Cytophagales bacterium]